MEKVDLSKKTVLVHDYGLFIELAMCMAKDFKEVIYYAPWKGSYPTPEKAMIGAGIPNLTRSMNFFDDVERADLLVFFDVYDGDLQEHFRKHFPDKRVFGTGHGEKLELDRVWFRETLKQLGLPVAKYKEIVGMDAMREVFKSEEDKWLKISTFRGLFETYHHKTYTKSLPKLDMITHKAGAYQKLIKFLVEDPIAPAVEVGGDYFISKGKHLSPGTYGIEAKDMGYVCKIMNKEDLPSPVAKVNDTIEPVLEEFKMNGMICTEIRVLPDGTPYYTDACMRAGCPPAELYCEMFKNFSEIIWGVAGGEDVKPIPATKYGAQIILKSDDAKEDWLAVSVPAKYRKWVKFRNLCQIGDQMYYIPQDKGTIIGSAIGIGNTPEEAEMKALEAADSVEAEGIYFEKDCFDQLDEEIEKAQKYGLGRF
jgi:hypothetical protein